MSPDFAKALAAARAEFPVIKRDRTVTVRTKAGGTYTFAYAPLETILAAVGGPLSKHGIALVQDIRAGTLVTILQHGEQELVLAPIPLAFREGLSAQEIGSLLTYAQRYSIKVALCLATEDDDDGNAAAPGNIYTVSPKTQAAIEGQAPATRYTTAAETLRACATLPELEQAWKALIGEERRALAYVKDQVKSSIIAADELARRAGDE